MSKSESILSGIRVLDFGRYVAGPYCATLLGYLGAEVIRIEKPDGGEDRYIAPITPQGEGGVFLQTACNKKSLTLDFGKPESREIVRRLVQSADVVVVNLPPAARESLGLDYATLSAINPRIILASQTAFGEHGPYASRGGFDGVGQAMSGAMFITGTPGAPAKAAAPYVDFSTAVLSAFGVLAALIERDRSGRGQHVQAALQATALAVFGSHLIEQGVTGINRVGTGNRVQTSAPSDVFATRDGHVLTHVVGNGLFRRWVKLMCGADVAAQKRWLDDPRLQDDAGRGEHSVEILATMRSWCASRTTDEAIAQLEAAGLPAGYPGLSRPAQVPNLPLRFSRSSGGIERAPPTLGEHTETVLTELGFDEAARAALRASGVV
jgi:crotonobetainyl-CoA:carnitine CoA-transferase CaiB-like acyl-CoA transferase